MRLSPLAYGIVAPLLLVSAAAADWPAGGLFASTSFAQLLVDAHFLEQPGGDLTMVSVGRCLCNDTYYTAQRVGTGGALAPGWPQTGEDLAPVLSGIRQFQQGFVVDDSARTWHSWSNGSGAFLYSIAGDGTPQPAIYSLGSSGGGPSHVAAAPGGEVFVTCGSGRIKRITSAGTPAAGWTTSGKGLPGLAYDDNAVLSDDSGGVIVFMRQGASDVVPHAFRLTGAGLVPSGWSAFGLGLSTVAMVGSDVSYDSQLLPSGPDHFLAVWSTAAGPGIRRLLMQRFGSDGTLDPAWPEDGLEVVAPDTLAACRAIPDGSGGAYVLRQAHGLPVGTHITGAGTILGGSDVNLLDAAAQYVHTATLLVGAPEELVADHTPDGGLLVGWNDTRLAPAVSYRLRWLTPSLTAAPGKPDTGMVAYPSSPSPQPGSLLAVRADGPDAALIAWGDHHGPEGDIGYGDLWMNRVQAPVVVSVGPHRRPAQGLALSAPRPNPAQGAISFEVTLPDDSPARVELLDIAGRIQRTQLVQGAGAHAVRFGNAGSLAPGLYFARVTHETGARSERVVVAK
jgi:hypothetical protein